MHEQLIALVFNFGSKIQYHRNYESDIGGLCYGACGLVIDAVLTDKKKIEKFNAKIDWLEKLIDERRIFGVGNSLSPEDKEKISKFLRKIMHHQEPSKYIEQQQPGAITYIQDIEKTMHSFQSKKLKELGGLHKGAVFAGFYDWLAGSADIKNYLTALQEAVKASWSQGIHIPFSLLWLARNHACVLGYRPDEKDATKLGTWYLFNINDKARIRMVDFNCSLAHTYLCVFMHASYSAVADYTALGTTLLCSKNNEKSAAILHANFLEELKKHRLTPHTAEKVELNTFREYLPFVAAKIGDTNTVEFLIKANVALNLQSLLIIAASAGHIEIVKLLIAAGSDFNFQDQDGCSALIDAVRHRHTDIVNFLLQAGADPNLPDQSGYSALRWAAHFRELDIVKLLIDNGADASQLHDHIYIFEEKFSALMSRDLLTTDEKKYLLKLYIVLRTSEEMDEEKNIVSLAKRNLTLFFKPACTYIEKIEVAKNMLEDLEQNRNFSSASLALRDNRLKRIYELCFTEDKAVPIVPDMPRSGSGSQRRGNARINVTF